MNGKPRKPKDCERSHCFSARISNPCAVVGVIPLYVDALACKLIGETWLAIFAQFAQRIGFADAAQIYA